MSSNVNKLILIKGFGENIRKLIFNSNKTKHNVPFLCMISNKMMSDFYMLGPRELLWILSNANGTIVVTFYGNM